MIRLGIIGLGGMGLSHAKAFAARKGCQIAAGADTNSEARARFAELFPDAQMHDEYTALLTDVDAVVIALPTGLHYRVASDALRTGVPVLLEKPMARTVSECRRLNELADKQGVLLMVAHCRRFDPYWGAWARQVGQGKIGFPVLWRHVIAGKGPGRWFMDNKLGGGPLLDGAVHNYDFANWIFGKPASVLASSIKLVPDVSAVDTATAVVRYESGDQLLLSWSWGTLGCNLHDILGPKGYIAFGPGPLTPPAGEQDQYQYCCLTAADGKPSLIKAKRQPSMLENQAKHFLQCLQTKTQCASPGTEAIKAVAVAEAILKAGPGGKARQVRW